LPPKAPKWLDRLPAYGRSWSRHVRAGGPAIVHWLGNGILGTGLPS
jgi:hypothetical protein